MQCGVATAEYWCDVDPVDLHCTPLGEDLAQRFVVLTSRVALVASAAAVAGVAVNADLGPLNDALSLLALLFAAMGTSLARTDCEPHGNSDRSMKIHHLYEIYKAEDYSTWKYGISGQPLKVGDGRSPRADIQVRQLNNGKGLHYPYDAMILFRTIRGRLAAKLIERAMITAHVAMTGRIPPGNLRPSPYDE